MNDERRRRDQLEYYEANEDRNHARLVRAIERVIGGTKLDPRVRDAFYAIPRPIFLPVSEWPNAYEDTALLLLQSEGETLSTVSQPSLVARKTQMVLHRDVSDMTALEIGSGTGYQLAILNAVGYSHVTGIEIYEDLADFSRGILAETLGIEVIHGDARVDIPDEKYNSIIVSAKVEDEEALDTILGHLEIGGYAVVPVGYSVLAGDQFYKQAIQRMRLRNEDACMVKFERCENGVLDRQPVMKVNYVKLK